MSKWWGELKYYKKKLTKIEDKLFNEVVKRIKRRKYTVRRINL